MSKRKPRTEADLAEAAKDVAFEFKMFRSALSRLDTSSPSLGNNNSAADLSLAPTSPVMAAASWSAANNNVPMAPLAGHASSFHDVEGVLIHYRNLIEFFFTERQDKSDLVLAHHYTGKVPQKAPPWARIYLQRCNELLAHLSYRRTQYRQSDDHHWTDILEKCGHMDNEITGFLNSLTPGRRAWFE